MAAKLEKTRHPGIYRRGGRYVVRYTDADGHARQESARTLDEARTLKASRIAAVASGEHHVASKIKFREYADEWVKRYQGRGSRGFRESTRDDYRRDLDRYVLPYFDGKIRRTIEQITPRDVANYVAWLCDEAEQGKLKAAEARKRKAAKAGVEVASLPLEAKPTYLADATIRRIMAPLRSCLSSAVAEGIIRQNPTLGVSLPFRDEQRSIDQGTDTEDEQVKALTTQELSDFFTTCPETWQPFFRLLASTGLRWSEATALRWQDLTLDGSNPSVKVRRAYVRGRYGPPKSKHSRRSVPIDADLVNRLRSHRKKSNYFAPDELVFPASNGEPLRHENVRRRVMIPAAQEASVPWIGFHTFRHTCATRLFGAGRNAVQVQRWLGHHSAAFTLSVYVHLMDDDLGGPLDSLEGVTKVSREDAETARNSTKEVPVFSH